MDIGLLRFLRRRRLVVELEQRILSCLYLADFAAHPVGVHESFLDPQGSAGLAHG